MHRDFAVWDGVYASFAEAPAEGPGFDGAEWRERSVAAVRQGLAAIANGVALDYSLVQRNVYLPAMVTDLLAVLPRVRVLDFGGGPGLGFVVVKQARADALARLDYTIVDAPQVCLAGRALFGAQGPVFRDYIPEDALFDIVHAASVLQYIEDWPGAIASLAGRRPIFLSLADVFCGAFGSYVTLQNYYGSRIRHWMLNQDELVATVVRNGYRLMAKTPCMVEVLGRRGPLPMSNLPEPLRIAHSQHLLFVRQDRAP